MTVTESGEDRLAVFRDGDQSSDMQSVAAEKKVDVEELSPADVFEANLIGFDDMENRPPPIYVVDRTLVANSVVVV